MPEMDGYELTAAIRADERGVGRILIMALTANAQEHEVDRCLEAWMDDCLTKPIEMALLESSQQGWTSA